MLPRETVAEEVKGLSQEDRAKLRSLGARFGAFNVYVPALLKPAPTELRLLLWALGLQKEGKLEPAALPQPPGQGLTSASFDRSTPKGFYGVCGYRICGSRVVRIDMLERLADVIRDRVFWRARFPEEARPAGSVEGGGFTVVPDMMSLVGCSGEDFLGILRSLDYRMQKKTVKRPAATPAAVAPDALKALGDDVASEPPADVITGEPSVQAEVAVALQSVEPPAESDTLPESPAETAEASETPVTASVEQDLAEATPAPEVAMEEVEIEVWWPRDTGPFRHRPERQQNNRRPAQRRDATATAAVQPAEGGDKPTEGERREGGRPHRHHAKGHNNRDKRREDRPEGQEARHDRKPRREDRKPDVQERKPRPEKPIDPDSPFAVLGALKAKLAGK